VGYEVRRNWAPRSSHQYDVGGRPNAQHARAQIVANLTIGFASNSSTRIERSLVGEKFSCWLGVSPAARRSVPTTTHEAYTFMRNPHDERTNTAGGLQGTTITTGTGATVPPNLQAIFGDSGKKNNDTGSSSCYPRDRLTSRLLKNARISV